ncbi:BsaWI family type II restriction enzyme [Planococcus notacanthi]|uniref:BsaWI family type II restriction enzyme n=1 Tax=Planococcus notacanthi TaxID=3035188 RepID=A0ABT7ZPS3_9BACL|nr:BsaWI family type II restriction enzyme [Planococcus sp. APC 4016]MDN3429157.1 BsaWI family type II restriction enzyme [Planococcus sp. APC 4016]
MLSSRTGKSDSKIANIEKLSQKTAIRKTTIEALERFPNIDASDIWKSVYSAHMDRKSGIADPEVIKKVVSAENSWKKSSGHAFEEMIEVLGNSKLMHHDIRILLQKDMKLLIENSGIHNEERDIAWLREQIRNSIFDLYVTLKKPNGEEHVYGCIQSKTSIRDRVTRDREPSMNAMNKFFWSVAICLDGEYLRMPKFIGMVNGDTQEHAINGWHGLYVLSDDYSVDRIYPIDIDLSLFVNHALQAAEEWLKNRQWFNHEWKAK